MRQSAGKSVKNRLAATLFAQQATGMIVAVGWAARIRNPVLLKTASRTRSAFWPDTGDNGCSRLSIAAVSATTQRGCCRSPWWQVDFLVACAPIADAPEPEWHGRHSYARSSDHIAPAGETEFRVRTFRRIPVGAIGKRRRNRSPGNGIGRKKEPTREESGGSQIAS